MGKIYLMGILLAGFSFPAAGQDWCGTEVTPEYIEYMQTIKQPRDLTGRISDVTIGVPVTIHIINRTDGTGGTDLADITGAIDIVNDYYSNANMYFFVDGAVDYINNTAFFDFERVKESQLANSKDVQKTLNIYFANTVSASGTALCGYATFPGGFDRVVMAKGCTPNGLTLAHELGHYFNLFHTHETALGQELVARTNCTNAGDLLCSTPADPNLTGKIEYNNNRCTYTGTGRDANGDFYTPDITNIMSYALDQCQNSFTQEQYERIRVTLEEQRDYLRLKYESFAVKFDVTKTTGCFPLTVTFEDTSIGAFERKWSFPGALPTVSTAKSPSVKFEEPGTYTITLEVTSSTGEEQTSVKEDYIVVIDPLANIQRTEVKRDFNNSNAIDQGDWYMINEDPNNFIRKAEVSAYGNGSGSILIKDYENANLQEAEYYVSPTLDFRDLSSVSVTLDKAYAFLPSETVKTDTLELLFKQRCDTEWNVLDQLFGDELKTATIASQMEFVPNADQWNAYNMVYERGNQENGDAIHFALRIINANGNDLYLDNIQYTPDYTIEAPVLASLEKRSGNRVIIRYTDQSNNESSFSIERSINGGDFEEVLTALRNSNAVVDESAIVEGEYHYRVRAVGEFSNSEYSNIESISNTVTAIDDPSDYWKEIQIFPNPARDVINIGHGADQHIRSAILFDLSGREHVHLLPSQNEKDLSIPVKGLSPGLYVLRIGSADGYERNYRIVIE